MTLEAQPQIVEKEAFRVAGLCYEGRSEHGEVPVLWDQFISRVGELVPDPTRWVGYGVARAIPGVDVAEGWEYQTFSQDLIVYLHFPGKRKSSLGRRKRSA